MSGNMWDRFDVKYVIYYTGYKERIDIMERELGRVSLSCEKIWQFPTPADSILMNHARFGGIMKRSVSTFNLAFGHYRAIKSAMCRGANSVLVLEDDTRFMKDLDEIDRILSSAPGGWDVLLLDPTAPKKIPQDTFRKTISMCRVSGGPWISFSDMRSTGCYAMSRNGMMQWCDIFEGGLSGRNKLVAADRQYVNMRCSKYLANPAISVQEMTAGWKTNTEGISAKLADMYRNCFGLDLSKYNIGAK